MLFWLFMTILLAAGGVALVLGYRYYQTGDLGLLFPDWFQNKPEPRLGVSEHAMVDSRRKLLLIRRDNVEHLVLTGGPVDLVIETGITPPEENSYSAVRTRETISEPPAPPVFTRQPRALGQAVNE
ncbi:MAG: hypothetical protein EKK41_09080 [Hyphomicrobiales bacterium]|jgi:hypothetical protein|nr:MAG: hypothetical protein EKK41_09080 [Hyphomicrobiales bacterium]